MTPCRQFGSIEQPAAQRDRFGSVALEQWVRAPLQCQLNGCIHVFNLHSTHWMPPFFQTSGRSLFTMQKLHSPRSSHRSFSSNHSPSLALTATASLNTRTMGWNVLLFSDSCSSTSLDTFRITGYWCKSSAYSCFSLLTPSF